MLKSDSSNGVFALSPASLDFSTAEGEHITVVINRSVGTFSSVVVSFEVILVNGGTPGKIAMDDFQPSSGAVTFSQGQTVQVSCCKTHPCIH